MAEIDHIDLPVRLATESDLAAVARLHSDNFTDAWSEDFWRRQVAASCGAPTTFALLYVAPLAPGGSAGMLKGLLLARRVVDEVEIITIAVEKAHRRQGVARRLLDQLIDDLNVSLPCRVLLEVSVENTAALALYASYGFATVGTREGYYRGQGTAPVDAKILAMDLRN